MKITGIEPTTVTIPIEAPLRHSNGVHWGRFVRTVVRVHTDVGITGYGELGGGGESAEQGLRAMERYLVGHDPFQLEQMRLKICNPTASLYNQRTQIHAALEFACLDIMGKYVEQPVANLLGGYVRDRVPFASYLFFRYPNDDGSGRIERPDELVEHALELREKHGFRAHKLKGGVFDPEYELRCFRELADAVGGDTLRFDPNAAWNLRDAIWFGQQIEDLRNDYLEDPTWGLRGMAAVSQNVRIPLATNTIVVDPETLSWNTNERAVDVVLLDTTFWGGIRGCLRAAGVCETMQLAVGVHSAGELGIQLATMLHLGACIPNLSFSSDAHYHHLTDDILVGGPLQYQDGAIKVPTGPGLGIEVDEEKVQQYAALYRELGPYQYDRDPHRPGWFSLVPNDRWAVPEGG